METGFQILDHPAVSMFLRGGPVMFVLLALSILMVAIILIKLRQFWRSDLKDTDFVDEVIRAVKKGEPFRAVAVLDRSRHPVARVLEQTLDVLAEGKPPEESDAAVRRAAAEEIQRLEARLGDLELIATVAPLLGLLGTVLGMIEAFAQVEQLGASVDASLLAGGIWQALLTTAYGLILAIPALSVAYVLQNRADRVRELMGAAVTELLAMRSILTRDRLTEASDAGI
jgi:biopolymer transport protein ExbB